MAATFVLHAWFRIFSAISDHTNFELKPKMNSGKKPKQNKEKKKKKKKKKKGKVQHKSQGQLLFTFPAFLNVIILVFVSCTITDVCGMTDNISFKWKLFRQNKNFVFSSLLTNKTVAMKNPNKILWLMHYQDWVKTVLSFGK